MSAQFKTLGVASFDEKIFICYQTSHNHLDEFSVDYTKDGRNFDHLLNAYIEKPGGRENIECITSFRFAKTGDIYNLLYLSLEEGKSYLNQATSTDFQSWQKVGRLFPITSIGVQVPFYNHKGRDVIFFSDYGLHIGLSEDGRNWNIQNIDVPPKDYTVGCITESGEGLLLIYFLNEKHDGHNHYSIWSVLLDSKDPTKVIWKTEKAIWYQPQEWIGKSVNPVGIVNYKDTLYSYWNYPGKGVFCVVHDNLQKYADSKSPLPHAKLIRNIRNPILLPSPDNMWESKQVFNAAAIYHNKAVHLLYRAIGDNDTSVLGYAVSKDGLNIDARSEKPAYVPRSIFEHPTYGKKIKVSPFESGGGGYGGIEDPRITKIGDKFYLTYVAFDGRNPPRVALSYISVKSFESKNWDDWSEPVLISPPGVVDKNACILSEQIDGKYVIFHRIYPDILIDMVDSLDDFDGKSVWLKGQYRIHPRPNFWDSNKIGMGPPPIKTKDGWLAIYQGVGFQDNSRYKIGAMLLDLNDPTVVTHRSPHPILEPEADYENGGFKAGVVYPCGAVVIGNKLIVYYGGSDTYLAAATADLNQFLDELKFDSSPHLDTSIMEKIPFNDKTD